MLNCPICNKEKQENNIHVFIEGDKSLLCCKDCYKWILTFNEKFSLIEE